MNIVSQESEYSVSEHNIERLSADLPQDIKSELGLLKRIRRANTGNIKKLKILYSDMDKLSEYTSRYSPCKKGCSHCCYYQIDISELEIEYIEKNTNYKKNKNPQSKREFHGEPCPFLNIQSGQCEIYEFRPYVCRRHFSLANTNTFCHPDLTSTNNLKLMKFNGPEHSYSYLRSVTSEVVYDIRQIFTGKP